MSQPTTGINGAPSQGDKNGASSSAPPSTPSSAPSTAPPTTQKRPAAAVTTWVKPCALLMSGLDGVAVGGSNMGLESEIASTVVSSKAKDRDPYMGFNLEFPRGQRTEEEGFGQCFKCK